MSDIFCSVKSVARDYQPISEVAMGSFWESEIPENGVFMLEKAIQKLLENAQKDDSVYISRGNTRKGSKIPLIVRFRDSYAGEDEDDEDEELKTDKEYKHINSVRIGGVVGAISGNVIVNDNKGNSYFFELELKIKSRMDGEDDYHFVNKILTYGDLNIHNKEVLAGDNELFDFLLMDVLAEYILAVIPKGHYRTYRRFEKNDDRLRGVIDFPRHIRENIGKDNGKISYSYRENTIDNSFNALLMVTYEYIKDKYPDIVEKKLDENIRIKDYLDVLRYEVSCSRDISRCILDNAKPIVHPFYSEYDDVRRVCLMLLRDEGLDIFDHNDDHVKGFLFYMPDLWELFLERVMKDSLEPMSVIVDSQKTNWFIENYKGKNAYSCKSRPDFVFSKDDKMLLILDAKFKPNWERAIKGLGLSTFCSEDINKCIRDMVVAEASGTGVIFPYCIVEGTPDGDSMKKEFEESTDLYKRRISKANERDSFYVFPIGIPKPEKEEEYNSWESRFDNYISLFTDKLKTVLDVKAQQNAL